MPPRKAATLSISLSPELAQEVATRVESGLYTSASEVVREALRLLLRTEAQQALERGPMSDSELSQSRFAEASRLMDLGLSLGRERMAELAREQESGPGLRYSPERLRRLKLDDPGE